MQLLFRQLRTKKSKGPDGIFARLLKKCAEELTPVWCIYRVPALWEKSVITPIPKELHPSENNDYRPVMITLIVMKCFEKCMVTDRCMAV